ncbi:MAG: ATP-binding protein [Acidobacteriaceae bacterium]
MTRRVFFKLLFAMVLVLLLGAVMLDVSQQHILAYSLQRQLEKGLTDKARLLALRVDLNDPATLDAMVRKEALAIGARVTILDANGAVLVESGPAGHAPSTLADRPEVHAVLVDHRAKGMRVAHGDMYVAVPAGDNVVRLAYPLSDVRETLRTVRHSLLLATLLSLLLATLVAAWIAHVVARRLGRITEFARRIASGDFSARIEEPSGDEISVVAKALDATADRLEQGFHALEDSRKELEAVLDSMEEAVIAVDAQGRIHWTNQVLQRFVGGPIRIGNALVQTVRDPDLLACVDHALRERVAAKGQARSVLPGRVFEISVAPMPGGSAVVVLHDVSEIERVEKTRRDFIANVSHELRTPLTSISGYAETLMEDDKQLSPQAREFLGIICKNATRMNRLTEDLLALARIESGEYKLRPQPVMASALVQDAVHLFAGSLLATDIRLEAGGLVQDRVLVDTDAVMQVLSNLLENAAKYGGAGKRIVIGAQSVPNAVEFSVQDFGAGIPSEHLARIFERFYRVDKGRSIESGGTGLGLSIVKHIVLAHGGGIRVESELNYGSTFFFTLPLAPGDTPAAP